MSKKRPKSNRMIHRNSVNYWKYNKEDCRMENRKAKEGSRDCYPERNKGCFMGKREVKYAS